MDALMIALLAAALAATGGAWWRFAQAMASRFADRQRRILIGALISMTGLAPAAAAAGAGALTADMNGHGRLLFLALALGLAGGGMLVPARAPSALLLRWSTSLPGALLALLLLLAGDSALFIILAAAARSGIPWAAAIGGAIGLAAALWLAIESPREWGDMRWIGRARQAAGAVLLLIAGAAAMMALRLL